MEDLIGVVIYLILAIIGILAGVYRTKQKKDQTASKAPEKAQPVPGVDTDYDPFSGLFEEEEEKDIISVDKEEEFVAEERTEEFIAEERAEELITEEEDKTGTIYVAEEQEFKEVADYKKDKIEGEAAFKMTEDVIISESITDEDRQIILTEEEMPLKNEIDKYIKDGDKFDLKKAIIYSEIINRREY
jgi:hypothetical protein